MKPLIVGVGIIGVIVFVVVALGASMKHPGYDDLDLGFTGPMERGAVSRSNQVFQLWPWPRGTTSRKEREEECRGTVHPGEVFEVLNHFRNGQQAWILARKRDEPGVEGWFLCSATDPVRATKLN